MDDILGERYAGALFDLAQEGGQSQTVRHDMYALLALLKSSPDFYTLVNDPTLTSDKRGEILKLVLQNKLDNLSFRFLLLLNRKRRLALLPSVAHCYEKLWAQAQGVAYAQVTTATPLSENDRQTVSTRLAKQWQKKVEIAFSEDKSLIGGLVIQRDDLVYDYSLRGRLDRFLKGMKHS